MRRRAFSLLEVLIAIGLMIALFGAMFAFMYDTLSARRRALEHAGRQLAATTLVERAELDLNEEGALGGLGDILQWHPLAGEEFPN